MAKKRGLNIGQIIDDNDALKKEADHLKNVMEPKDNAQNVKKEKPKVFSLSVHHTLFEKWDNYINKLRLETQEKSQTYKGLKYGAINRSSLIRELMREELNKNGYEI